MLFRFVFLSLLLFGRDCGAADGFADLFLQSGRFLLRVGVVCVKIITEVTEILRIRVEKSEKSPLRTEKTLLAAEINGGSVHVGLFDRKNMIYVPDIGEVK